MLGKRLYGPTNLRPVNCQMIGRLYLLVCSQILVMYWIIYSVVMMLNLMVEAHAVHTRHRPVWLIQLSLMNCAKMFR